MPPDTQHEAKKKATKSRQSPNSVLAEPDGPPAVQLTKPTKRKKAGLIGGDVARAAASSVEAASAADSGTPPKHKKRTRTDGDVKV